jgi:hypothetical protein
MRAPQRFMKHALEYMTQYVLLPGVEMHFDEVMVYYKTNFNKLSVRFKNLASKNAMH